MLLIGLNYDWPFPQKEYRRNDKPPVPSAPVRAFIVFAGPVPPELTADTLMTYMV